MKRLKVELALAIGDRIENVFACVCVCLCVWWGGLSEKIGINSVLWIWQNTFGMTFATISIICYCSRFSVVLCCSTVFGSRNIALLVAIVRLSSVDFPFWNIFVVSKVISKVQSKQPSIISHIPVCKLRFSVQSTLVYFFFFGRSSKFIISHVQYFLSLSLSRSLFHSLFKSTLLFVCTQREQQTLHFQAKQFQYALNRCIFYCNQNFRQICIKW